MKYNTDILPYIRGVIESVTSQSVEELNKFISTNPTTPLFCTACGGSFSAVKYAALMYSALKGVGIAMTPLTLSSVSDEVLKLSKVLILSNSGRGRDISYIMKRMNKLNPEGTAAITRKPDREGANELLSYFEKAGISCSAFTWEDREAFIDTFGVFVHYALLYMAFTGKTDFNNISFSTEPNECFRYERLRSSELPAELKDINHFVTLYSGWGEPVAVDFESKMTEAGYASVQLCDYRNFMHGRFMFMSNHFDDSALVLIKTNRDTDFIDKMWKGRDRHKNVFFPDGMQVITIETDIDSPLASIDLLFKMSVLYGEIGASKGYDPCNPKNPAKFQKQGPRDLLFKGLAKEHGLAF